MYALAKAIDDLIFVGTGEYYYKRVAAILSKIFFC